MKKKFNTDDIVILRVSEGLSGLRFETKSLGRRRIEKAARLIDHLRTRTRPKQAKGVKVHKKKRKRYVMTYRFPFGGVRDAIHRPQQSEQGASR